MDLFFKYENSTDGLTIIAKPRRLGLGNIDATMRTETQKLETNTLSYISLYSKSNPVLGQVAFIC